MLLYDGQPVLQRRAVANHKEPIYTTATRFQENVDEVGIVYAQEIPDSFVSMLRQMKQDSMAQREREFMHVACIPDVFVAKYMREGFNIYREPVKETCKRLMRDGLDSFVVTNKRF